jgi:hypothetical protein
MNCKICNRGSKEIFEATILNKYSVKYYQCNNCHFVQTEEPYWLSEAYDNAIASTDVGLVYRNISFSNIAEKLIKLVFDYKGIFLDYAGGYGLFVRLMRDKGFNFYRQDIYCQNIFAHNVDIEDLQTKPKFELVTAFEVFEHLKDPMTDVESILKYSGSVLFSTQLLPGNALSSISDWWYFAPESGQHISFYSQKSLEIMAQRFGYHFFTNGTTLHLFTKKKLGASPFIEIEEIQKSKGRPLLNFLKKIVSRLEINTVRPVELESLLQQDFLAAKKKISGL